jgi:hypothetical protein
MIYHLSVGLLFIIRKCDLSKTVIVMRMLCTSCTMMCTLFYFIYNGVLEMQWTFVE